MSSMFSFWSALFLFPFFLGAALITFFLPGFFLLKNLFKKSFVTLFVLSISLGIVLWGFQGYIFGYFHLRFFTYVYVLFFVVFGIVQREIVIVFFIKFWHEFEKLPKLLFVIILAGIILQLIPVVGSGILYKDGVRFFSINATDGVMHLAYIQSMIHTFPPTEPGAHGDLLTNYHYWSDMVISEIARIWLLPIPHLYFRYFPVLVSFLTGLLTYLVLTEWRGGVIGGLWGVVFIYFSGDAPFIFSVLHKSWGFTTPAIDNGALQFINMPHAMARMIFLGGLVVFSYWEKIRDIRLLYFSVLIFASLIGFKVYFGMFAAVGVCFVFVLVIFRRFVQSTFRFQSILKEWKFFLLLVIFFGLQLSIFLPPNKSAGGLYFSPLDWPKLLLGSGGVDFSIWWKFYRLFLLQGQQFGIIFLDAIAIILSLIIIYGTRVLGFIPSQKVRRLPLEMLFFLIPGVVIFNVLGLFTLQVSGGLNVFNFFAVTTVPLALFSALFMESVQLRFKRYGFLLALLLLFLTVPRSFFEDGLSIYRYATSFDSYLVSRDELAGLAYIRNTAPTGALVQSHPMNHWDMRTPYVAFFTNHDTFLSGIGIQETHNQPIGDKKQQLQFIFSAPNSDDLRSKLLHKNISYFYWRKNTEESLPFVPTHGHFFYRFENNGVIVLSPKQ